MKVVAIQNYGPSGTMLLHSLLDGHSQTLTLPGLYPIGLYSGWRHLIAGIAHRVRLEDVVTFLMEWLAPLYDASRLERPWGLAELGAGRNEHCCVSRGDMHAHVTAALAELDVETALATATATELGIRRARKAAVLAAFLAYTRARGVDTSDRRVLIYPAHASEVQDLHELAEDFPNLSVIHMIRDPVDGLFATVKYNQDWQARFSHLFLLDPFRCAILQITVDRTPLHPRAEPFHALRPYAPALASRSRAVRLEDLHRAPEMTMRAIAEWIGLPWEQALLESTFAGKTWWNRPGLRRVSGFKVGMARTEGVSVLDRLRIAAVTAPVRRRYGYDGRRSRTWFTNLAGLLTLAAPFTAERHTADAIRHYGLFVVRGPVSLLPRAHAARLQLLSDLVEAKTSPASVGRIEWWCASLYGRVHTYCANRAALLAGLLHLRRQADWVELLTPEANR